MITGKRSISRSSMLAKITSGIEIAKPMTSSVKLPLAAATPSTLSRLITVVGHQNGPDGDSQTAARLDFLTAIVELSNWMPIQSKTRSRQFQIGHREQNGIGGVRTMRMTIAAADPQVTAFFCCFGGSDREASAITTALSPESTILIPIICASGIRNCSGEVKNSSIVKILSFERDGSRCGLIGRATKAAPTFQAVLTVVRRRRAPRRRARRANGNWPPYQTPVVLGSAKA